MIPSKNHSGHMYKIIIILLLGMFCLPSVAQTLLLKMGKDGNMEYSSTENTIITPEEGIHTERHEIYLMAGFDKRVPNRRTIKFSIKGTEKINVSYNKKPAKLSFSDKIYSYLELIKIEFLEEVDAEIGIKIGNEGETIFPLRYRPSREPAMDTLLLQKDNEEVLTGQDSETNEKENLDNQNQEASFFSEVVIPWVKNNIWQTVLLVTTGLFLLAISFWLGTRLTRTYKEKTDNVDEVSISEHKVEAIQLSLLEHLVGQSPTENYSFQVQEKVRVIKGQISEEGKSKIEQADYDLLNLQLQESKAQNALVKNQLTESNLALANANNLLDSANYQSYYLSFNDGLSAIFTDLEKARENLKSDSNFNEIFNKILNYEHRDAHHPLLDFYNRDKHILKSLNMDSRKQLTSLSKELFFDKFVLWHCGSLINNLSKLHAYVHSNEENLSLGDILRSDGARTENIESAFNKLSKLLDKNFGKSIQLPEIGKAIANPTSVDKVDYCFVKAKYYDKLPYLESGTVYDINKAGIVNKSNSLVIQKAQVCVKI